jgi:hypothetical protein
MIYSKITLDGMTFIRTTFSRMTLGRMAIYRITFRVRIMILIRMALSRMTKAKWHLAE